MLEAKVDLLKAKANPVESKAELLKIKQHGQSATRKSSATRISHVSIYEHASESVDGSVYCERRLLPSV
eukprot:363813-Chlamydomonas_euryale.AAC.7